MVVSCGSVKYLSDRIQHIGREKSGKLSGKLGKKRNKRGKN